jgi:hypothetical protein
VSIGDTQEHPLGVYLEKYHCISILLKLNVIIFYLIDDSIPICRLLLYSLSVFILIPMSLPEERNINKGRWTEEEHKIFMQEYEKYGNNCILIAKVLST